MDNSYALSLLEGYRENAKAVMRMTETIDSYAVSTYGGSHVTTMSQLNKISDLFERQRVYIRRVKFVKKILDMLPIEEKRCLVHYFIKGLKGKELEKYFSYSARTFYRNKKQGVERFIKIAGDMEVGELNSQIKAA